MPLWRLVLPQLLTQLSLSNCQDHQVHAQPNCFPFPSHAWHLALKEISESILGSDIFWGDEHHKNPGWIAHWSLENLDAKYPILRELVRKGWTIHVSNLSIWNQIKQRTNEWEWGFMIFHGSAKTLVAPRYMEFPCLISVQPPGNLWFTVHVRLRLHASTRQQRPSTFNDPSIAIGRLGPSSALHQNLMALGAHTGQSLCQSQQAEWLDMALLERTNKKGWIWGYVSAWIYKGDNMHDCLHHLRRHFQT